MSTLLAVFRVPVKLMMLGNQCITRHIRQPVIDLKGKITNVYFAKLETLPCICHSLQEDDCRTRNRDGSTSQISDTEFSGNLTKLSENGALWKNSMHQKKSYRD